MKLGLAPALLLSLAAATIASAAPPTMEEARALLAQAASEKDAATAQDLARRALPGFLALLKPDSECWLLAITAEAQIRAGDPKGALTTIAKAARPDCDTSAFASLAGWAHEYGTGGVRRGEGAQLALSQALYLKSADLLEGRPGSADAIAASLANAGEIALQLGDAATARRAGLAGLKVRPSRDIAIRNGLVVLAAAGPEIGEGAATDLVTDAADGSMDLLRDILDMRVEQVSESLKARPGDPHLLVAAGFYSFFTGGDVQAALARIHLDKAAESGFPLIELWYLQGRAAEGLGETDKAKEYWRRQQREFPKAAASRLAANDLAYLLGTKGGTPTEMAEALASLDAHVAATPAEAALHETRSVLLERMGRKADALAAAERAQALQPTDERTATVERLRTAR